MHNCKSCEDSVRHKTFHGCWAMCEVFYYEIYNRTALQMICHLLKNMNCDPY